MSFCTPRPMPTDPVMNISSEMIWLNRKSLTPRPPYSSGPPSRSVRVTGLEPRHRRLTLPSRSHSSVREAHSCRRMPERWHGSRRARIRRSHASRLHSSSSGPLCLTAYSWRLASSKWAVHVRWDDGQPGVRGVGRGHRRTRQLPPWRLRLAAPDDISDAVVWLASDLPRTVTGTQLTLDMGATRSIRRGDREAVGR